MKNDKAQQDFTLGRVIDYIESNLEDVKTNTIIISELVRKLKLCKQIHDIEAPKS